VSVVVDAVEWFYTVARCVQEESHQSYRAVATLRRTYWINDRGNSSRVL